MTHSWRTVMARRSSALLTVATLVTLIACAQRPPATGATPFDRNDITPAQIDRIHARTALDVVMHYRADQLMARGPSPLLVDLPARPVVFFDWTYYGTIAELKNHPASTIGEIKIFSGIEAASRFGGRYQGGVIQILPRR